VSPVLALAEELGMARTAGAFLRGNKAEALLRAGRWEEALSSTEPGAAAAGVFAGALLSLRAEIHALAGRRVEAQAELREARRHLRHGRAAQFAFPIAGVDAELARAAGDLDAARSIVEGALRQGPGADDERSDELERLGITERELEVLRLLADGRSNSEIAQELFISRSTASAHVSHILAKLGVSTRVQAAAVAHRRGLISPRAD
jgi:DNA-binding CsgD family transcriptional regulator